MPRLISSRGFFYFMMILVADLVFMPIFRIGSFQPSLLYLAVVYAALEWHWRRAVPTAIAAGLARDFLGSGPFLVETLALLIASVGLSVLVQKIERGTIWMRFTTAFLFIFVVLLLNFFLAGLLGRGTQTFSHSITLSAGTALWTSFWMPIFFYLSGRWFHDHVTLKQYELFG